MPTVIDATVINQPYDTSGNGGRKLVRLSNGWLVAGVYDSINSQIKFFASQDNGQTFQQLCYVSGVISTISFALASKGTNVYLLATMLGPVMGFVKFDATTVTNTDLVSTKVNIDTGQSSLGGGASLAINEAGTELHAAWASKNSTYPNSLNIRYAKGTINADGSVTWGSVTQVTKVNSANEYLQNPSIIVKDGFPYIFVEAKGSDNSVRGGYYLLCMSTNLTGNSSAWVLVNPNKDSAWGDNTVYSSSSISYPQSSPSACVDKNGRIWVAWHGAESGYNAGEIRVSYSDDGGVTWSTQQRLTTNNQETSGINPSITVNKNNEIFILYNGRYGTDTYKDIYLLHYNGSSWTNTNITNTPTTGHNQNPSALVDLAIDFTQPLFIYSAVQRAKVGFYGTWVVNTISVTPDYIGQKTSADRTSFLTYSITTDGTMSDITEKINGVTIATRTNPTSGQNFTVSLTHEQWDAIKYGNGHTLTIEMGSDVWTYTFDKRLNANDDILSAVKGVQDLQDHLNAIKAQLGSAIRAKGGTVNDTDAWSAFVSAVNNLGSKRRAAGITTSSTTTINFYNNQGSSSTSYYVQVTGLTFMPSVIILTPNSGSTIGYPKVAVDKTAPLVGGYTLINRNGSFFRLDGVSAYIDSSSFRLPYANGNESVYWIAYE